MASSVGSTHKSVDHRRQMNTSGTNADSKSCIVCRKTHTPQWRADCTGNTNMCNACWVRWRRSQRKTKENKKNNVSKRKQNHKNLDYDTSDTEHESNMDTPDELNTSRDSAEESPRRSSRIAKLNEIRGKRRPIWLAESDEEEEEHVPVKKIKRTTEKKTQKECNSNKTKKSTRTAPKYEEEFEKKKANKNNTFATAKTELEWELYRQITDLDVLLDIACVC